MEMFYFSAEMVSTGMGVTAVIAVLAYYFSPRARFERKLRKEFDQ